MFGHGSAITFLNVNDATETFYRVCRPHADGFSCLAGHMRLPLFAYAEQSNAARIHVVQWPDMRPLCTLHPDAVSAMSATSVPSDGVDPVASAATSRASTDAGNRTKTVRRILSISFGETEHLAVLTGYPDFVLEIWNWRTGRRLIERATEVFTDVQYLK